MSTEHTPRGRMDKQVEIHTDGACLGNPGPGGWAALLRFREIGRASCRERV